MKNYILECCVDSAESAIHAAAAGASRLELCANLVIGGTTPSPYLFKEIRKYSRIPIHVLIRPRFGDFCYSAHEIEIMRQEILMFKELGADAAVIGVLKPDGELDMEAMKTLIEAAGDMKITLHRAFDVCRDPYKTLEEAIELGVNTILTSGQKGNCLLGRQTLEKLTHQADGRVEILVGAGVDAAAIKELAPTVGTASFHMSGKITKPSRMEYRKEGVNMGLPSLSEFEIWETSEEKVREAAEVLKSL